MNTVRVKTAQQTFETYDSNIFDLIPLDGKAPRDKNWTTRTYDSAKIRRAAIKARFNVGVRLKPNQLVIDIDPRNGGLDSFERFCIDHGLDDSLFPRVVTGSGGLHIYMAKPADVLIRKGLKEYPGIDFLSRGTQVVAAGSIHPGAKKPYIWDDDFPDVRDGLPAVPTSVLDAITRPASESSGVGGEYSPEQIAAMLDALDPADFREHSVWLRLMQACHHASSGDAREQFIEWSISDPEYSDQAEMIGKRWDSLHEKRDDAVTAASLRYELEQRGLLHVIPAADASGDFDAIDDEDLSWLDPPSADAPAIRLNQVNAENINNVFSLVNVGGKTRVLYWGKSPIDRRVRVPELWATEELGKALANRFVVIRDEEGGEKRIPLAKWWLTRRGRYTFDGLIFDADEADVSESDEINLWRGFGIDPAPGNWSRMRKHIRDIIADGDDASFDYIIRWIAWGFQNPTKQAEVALVLLSKEKGTGKGFLARALCEIYGAHGLHISQRSHLVGKFNAHFAQAAFVFCDEALWPGNHDDEGPLKALVTEPTMQIEPKGVNAYRMPNALKIVMASNNDWVVPASGDERRYAVFQASDRRKQDHRYFERLRAEIEGGGLAAMLHDLQDMDLKGWHPRHGVPETKALAQQKLLSAPPEIKFLGDLLGEAVLPCQHPSKPYRAPAADLYDFARRKYPSIARWTDNQFADFLKSWNVERRRVSVSWWDFPPLADMRRDFRARHPWHPPFDDADEWMTDLGHDA
ncbi:hypothetical protein GGQ85_000743 [Nitrobacter vulgaris]|uniref:DUF5906 domain-containing protein n=1 Tax=Nitrobacter vulgaris TaxID=29421 RepID=UPI002859DAD6|nr:DUF5906 domain-containing protein [Nitrobacter vulgaris]MDR6303062.1 hypothetical protein [Nitrobacter vulgaris]